MTTIVKLPRYNYWALIITIYDNDILPILSARWGIQVNVNSNKSALIYYWRKHSKPYTQS